MAEYTELDFLAADYSDMYKDTYGVRPRFDASTWTADDYQDAMYELAPILAARIEEEAAAMRTAVAQLEVRIASLIALGAKDRAMAISWLDQALETNGDLEYLCYCLGVPYGYFKEAA